MSILSEQSIASSGPHKPQNAPLCDPTAPGKTALPAQPLQQDASLSNVGQPMAETTHDLRQTVLPTAALSPAEQQQRLQALCAHPSLHSGDLVVAAAIITQISAEVLAVDRVSLWQYETEASFILCDSYDSALKTHTSGSQIAIAEHTSYFETLHQRDGLTLENSSSLLATCQSNTTRRQAPTDPAPIAQAPAAEGIHAPVINAPNTHSQSTYQTRKARFTDHTADAQITQEQTATAMTISSLVKAGLLLPGAFLELPVRIHGRVVGVLWCERRTPHRWTGLQRASSVAISLLTAIAIDAQQRQSMSSTLTHQRRQLKRETIEREQAEQAWQESQRFIQGIIDASTNILYVDSFVDGSNFYINRWIQNVLGYSPTDIRNMGASYLEKLVHADEKPLMAKERKKLSAINDGEVVENEYRFRHRQGNWRWLLCRETVFQRDEDGQPTQIFGTATDITKRKHAEVALKEFNEELERLARMDGLTQVANRRSFDEYLAQEWNNVGSGRSALSLILCDIDYFKSFNDTYGHQAGDVCLRQVAQAIEKAVKRNTDLVARYGGEEFAIILPNTNEAGVEQVAQEIQREIRSLGIPHSQSEVSNCITLSLGIASVTTTDNAHPDMLVACADQGLYQAKYEGRDRFSRGRADYR